MQYKTTRDFLVQFGLDNLAELPNLKELEELSRAALGEDVEDQQPSLPGVDESQAAEQDLVEQADTAEDEEE
jgi:segregation and condensation protein B